MVINLSSGKFFDGLLEITRVKQVASSAIEYRPDIDGLRALAVLAVLLFHADLGCRGGFVGVDIFFVISGFLISSLLLKQLHAGTFSLLEFWERRIRRVVPACAVVVAASLVLGWFMLLPSDFVALGKSAIAQATLLSNVFFWMQTKAGYFAVNPDTMPLLHTWSLAVEEQFYILFPLLLFIPVRGKRMTFFELIICLWVGSFVLSVFGTKIFPNFTFCFLPTRAWELLTGTLLAVRFKNLPTNRLVREISGCLGLGLMLYAIFCFDRNTRFPGTAALSPCLGAALFILSSKGDYSLVGRLFMFRPVVFIGLISYSLYLWHWPLLVFARSLATGELSVFYKLGLLAANLGLAILTWKFIETPIRTRRVLRVRWQIFSLAGGCTVTFVMLGALINHQHGWSQRLSPKALEYLDVASHTEIHFPFLNQTWPMAILKDNVIELGSQSTNQPVFVMICGDSHAMAVTPAIDELCRKYSRRGTQATLSSTPPIIGYITDYGFSDSGSRPDEQPTFADAILGYVVRNHVRNVVLAARWHDYSDSKAFKTNLASTVRQLLDAGAKVYLLKDVPAPEFDVPRIAAAKVMCGVDVETLGFSKVKHEAAERDLYPAFDMDQQLGAILLEPSGFFLDSQSQYRVAKEGKLLYWDSHHLTVEGSRLLLPLFEPIFKTD